MCFGNDAKSKQVDTTSSSSTSGPSWLTTPAQQNISFAQNLQTNGFTPYTGQQVAGFSPQQQASFSGATDIANSVNGGPIGQLTSNYANAGPQSVSADPIYSQMSPYMNQYVNLALKPQLQMQDQQFATQNKAVDSAATMSGAFGDTGWGQLRGTTTQAQDAARTGLIGNAYNAAFNTAIGAGAQDVSNRLNAGTTNASLAETALGRQLTGANAMQAQQTGATNLENQYGGQQTAQTQAELNAAFNQWQMGQQYPFQTTQLVNSTLGAATPGAGSSTTGTKSEVTSAPDNSGFGMAGALGSSAISALAPMALAALADGGKANAGQPTIVGERGPELMVPGADGVVIPNEVLQAARMLRAAKVAQPQSTLQFGIAA